MVEAKLDEATLLYMSCVMSLAVSGWSLIWDTTLTDLNVLT
ncbi:unnamed protein product, partial [Arabidopsis halleri]